MNYLKLNIAVVLSIWVFGQTFAQQSIPVYEQYFVSDPMIINASFAGDTEDMQFKATHRRQWQDFNDSPETTTVSIDANIIDRVGLGMYFASDKNGNTDVNSFNIAGAYHIPLSDNGEDKFSFGTSLSFAGYRFTGNTELPGDPLYEGETSIFIPYINFGGSVQYHGWMAAVSILDLPLAYNDPIVNEIEPSPVYMYGMAGKKFNLGTSFQVEPIVMYRFNRDDKKQLDANLRARYTQGDQSFWIGGNYRYDMSDGRNEGLSVSPILGAEIGKLNMAFAYNVSLTDIGSEGGNGWSISLGYDIGNIFKSSTPIEE